MKPPEVYRPSPPLLTAEQRNAQDINEKIGELLIRALVVLDFERLAEKVRRG
jgi:hypothetical protein